MLEYILDFNELSAFYTIYAGIIVGLILKSIWVWAIDDTNLQSFPTKLELTLPTNDRQLQIKSRNFPNSLLIWIIKFIRNKSGTTDEVSSFISPNH